MQFFVIRNVHEVESRVENIKNYLLNKWDFSKPCQIKFNQYAITRTISQNNLMWKWLSQISEWATKRGWTHDDKRRKPEEVWKIYFINQVFGLEKINMGKEEIEVLPGSSELSAGEMQNLLEYINAWAIDKGINLLIPKDSEYYLNNRL